MAEVHLIGTIVGASFFPKPELCLKYLFVVGDEWTLLEGEITGQTQVDVPLVLVFNIGTFNFNQDPNLTVFSHPIGLSCILFQMSIIQPAQL
jgi:B9 domain-containing protein 2